MTLTVLICSRIDGMIFRRFYCGNALRCFALFKRRPFERMEYFLSAIQYGVPSSRSVRTLMVQCCSIQQNIYFLLARSLNAVTSFSVIFTRRIDVLLHSFFRGEPSEG